MVMVTEPKSINVIAVSVMAMDRDCVLRKNVVANVEAAAKKLHPFFAVKRIVVSPNQIIQRMNDIILGIPLQVIIGEASAP